MRKLSTAPGAVVGCLAALLVTACSPVAPQTPGKPSTPSNPAQAVAIRAYEFPGGMIEGASGGGKLYTRVNAVVAIPSAPGPHPVVVVVHGSYPSCLDLPKDKLFTKEVQTVSWPQGCGTSRADNDGLTRGPDYLRTPASLAYLARSLAERGMVAVIPDDNTKERLDWGGEPDSQVLETNLVKLHLDLVRRISAGESFGLQWAGELSGKVDPSRVGLVGHSSGGGYVVQAAARGLIPNLFGVVALEPAFGPLDRARTKLPPTLVVAGECDEQIPVDDVDSGVADLAKNTEAVVLYAKIPHATHIGMMFGGGSHTLGLVHPLQTPACAPAALLPKAVQRGQAAELIADSLGQAMSGRSNYVLASVPGVTVTATAQTSAGTVEVGKVDAILATVDPKSVTFSHSQVVVLPAKPESLILNDPKHV